MERSFDEVFQQEFAPLYGYLRRRVGPAAAEDVTAEVFAIAFRNWDDLIPSLPAKPWLYGIASNVVRHYWRKERRMLRAYARFSSASAPDAADDSAGRLVYAKAQQRALAQALSALRPDDREVLLLHAWAELSDSEIAEALAIPLGTAKSRLHRARALMENQIGEVGQVGVGTATATSEAQS